MGRISGPLMDRFDLRVEVPPVHFTDLDLPASGESSAEVAQRVAAARAVQDARYEGHDWMRTNADAEGNVLKEITELCSEGKDYLTKGAERFGLSARGYHRVLRLARTIADLDGAETVSVPHIAEAVGYRLINAREV